MASILTFVETRDGAVKRPSLEAAGEAQRQAATLGLTPVTVLVGPNSRALAAQIPARTAYAVEDARLSAYAPAAWTRAIVAAARKSGASAVFLSATAMGRDLAPRVAAHFEASAVTDCTAIRAEGGSLAFVRPVYAGKALLTVKPKKSPAVATLRPNLFAAATGGSPAVEALDAGFEASDFAAVVSAVEATSKGRVELTEASVIVSGGRGFKGPENFPIRDALADVLGAAVGASRAVVDAGWRPHSEQVGQTGKTVSPNLYFALGISGAIQHLAGMSSSKVIVAINKDADAPIFKAATYGIVGDLFEVVPALTEKLRQALK